MAADERVDGDAGWISDESDFYGDENVRSQLEREARRGIKRCYDSVLVQPSPLKKSRTLRSPPHFDSAGPKIKSETGRVTKIKTEPEEDVLDFLKSRPQLKSLKTTHKKDIDPTCKEPARTVAGEVNPDIIEVDHFKGHPSAWQQTESIDAFLKRLPVNDPNTSTYDGWLWVGSARQPYTHVKGRNAQDMASFMAHSDNLLENCIIQNTTIVSEMDGKAQAAITRKMSPYRNQLECDLLALAVETGITSGKWMLFPGPTDLARYWRLVATATSEGKLGPTSKSAVYDPHDPETVICIYTYDFTDSADVRRVLEELVELGLCSADGKRIYYKCDAYTHLGIKSKNDYKLRASLYSSTEILRNEVKALADGPVARMKRSQRKMGDFFSAFSDDLV